MHPYIDGIFITSTLFYPALEHIKIRVYDFQWKIFSFIKCQFFIAFLIRLKYVFFSN